jgi:glycosyltransferase involved in cell wall biosynthesis
MMQKTLAIFTPDQNTYSETFIHAHKNLPFNIKYYYNGLLPTQLEGKGSLLKFSTKERIEKRIRKEFTLQQYGLLYSLKREKVDCVLAEYGPTACETLQVVKYLKLPLVVHFHGYDASIISIIEKYKTAYKEVFDYADSIIAVSKKMKDGLITMKCPEGKIRISTYGPHATFFDCKPEYNNKQFVSVGRFVEKKAPYLTILAFKKLVEKFPDAKLKMIGAGELLTISMNLVCALNLENNVEFLGIKSTKEIAEIFEESIAFVQHSIVASNGDSEGTPVAALEAQAAGLPVISTDHGGIPDVVIHNETGFLVKELDVEEMANYMMSILGRQGLSKKLGQAGRERISNNFSMEKHLEILTRALKN